MKSHILTNTFMRQIFYLLLAAPMLGVSALAVEPSVEGIGSGDRTRQTFTVDDHQAFVFEPPKSTCLDAQMPWVWYAPTFAGRLPGPEEDWMIKRFHDRGIAIAGIDVGESYRSPAGREVYQSLYEELISKRGYSKKPVLLVRSRGGLMLYNWAVEHPHCVAGVAGVYPVCNIASYPGVAKAAGAYEVTADALQARLSLPFSSRQRPKPKSQQR